MLQQFLTPLDTFVTKKARNFQVVILENVDFDTLTDHGYRQADRVRPRSLYEEMQPGAFQQLYCVEYCRRHGIFSSYPQRILFPKSVLEQEFLCSLSRSVPLPCGIQHIIDRRVQNWPGNIRKILAWQFSAINSAQVCKSRIGH
jgi:hypothetical protein